MPVFCADSCPDSRQAIECGIDLDGGEVPRVVRQQVPRRGARRIERADPVAIVPAGRADADAGAALHRLSFAVTGAGQVDRAGLKRLGALVPDRFRADPVAKDGLKGDTHAARLFSSSRAPA